MGTLLRVVAALLVVFAVLQTCAPAHAKQVKFESLDQYIDEYVPSDVLEHLMSEGVEISWKPIKSQAYKPDAKLYLDADFKNVHIIAPTGKSQSV